MSEIENRGEPLYDAEALKRAGWTEHVSVMPSGEIYVSYSKDETVMYLLVPEVEA